MKHDKFIERVRHRAALPSREKAEVVTSAVLETLVEWLLGNEPVDNLAEWVLGESANASAQLPEGFAGYLEYIMSKNDEPLFLDEFFIRVSNRAKIAISDAIFQSGVVIEVLQEASDRSKDEMPSQFPQDYLSLFEAGRTRKVPIDC